MRRKISLIVKDIINIDIEIDDLLTVEEVLFELKSSKLLNIDVNADKYLARLLVKQDIVSLKTELNTQNIGEGEIIYVEPRREYV